MNAQSGSVAAQIELALGRPTANVLVLSEPCRAQCVHMTKLQRSAPKLAELGSLPTSPTLTLTAS